MFKLKWWQNGIIFTVIAMLAFFFFCIFPRMACASTEIELNPLFMGYVYSSGEYYPSKIVDVGYKLSGDTWAYGLKICNKITDDIKESQYYSYYKRLFFEKNWINTEYRYQRERNNVGLDIGYVVFSKFNFSCGYIYSWQDKEADHLATLKLNFPLAKRLAYRFHMRSAFTPERDFEWWTQIDYKIPIIKVDWFIFEFDALMQLSFQLDHEYNKTIPEFRGIFIFKKE